jgi:uncharacterized protein (DUF433 family)
MADFNDRVESTIRPEAPPLGLKAAPSLSSLGALYWCPVMFDETLVVHSDPEILSGTPVFVGTRVPVRSLFDYIEGGDTLDEFLRQFPSVRREQAIAALELARESLLTRARTA